MTKLLGNRATLKRHSRILGSPSTRLGCAFLSVLILMSSDAFGQYTMPPEEAPHEGTWLQWPHNFTYGSGAEMVEPSWVAMTKALVAGERVHIMAYDEGSVAPIAQQLETAGVDMGQVDILVCANDDFWVRDNGPLFVQDDLGEWVILDWGFNGWGGDAPFALDDGVPTCVAGQIGLSALDLGFMVLEGGSVELDASGTLAATRSSITGEDRNPGLSEAEIEEHLAQYLGVDHFIWLDGQFGGSEDITDQHIDAFLRFVGDHTLVTMNDADLDYWWVGPEDRAIIGGAINAVGQPYTRVDLPLTAGPVQTSTGANLGIRGSYVNYYVGNAVVLVPHYADPMDEVALGLVQSLYPNREAVGIDCRDMFQWGGMVHCVTQQQPLGAPFSSQSLPVRHGTIPAALYGRWDIMGRKLLEPPLSGVYIEVGPQGRHMRFAGAE